jgi:hypothetical protein
MSTLSKLQDLTEDSDEIKPFGPYQEEAIISLALDHPEFFTSVGRFMKPEMFGSLECRWVIAEILNSFEKHNVVPPRPLLRDKMVASLTEDDPWQRILELVDRPSDPREVPIIKDTLLRWAQDRAYGLIYSEEAQEAYARGDYEELESIVESANRIADVGQQAFWFLDNYEILFEPDVIDHKTTGFPSLDRKLNNGGPSTKEVVCWLAATNVGKSIVLCNNAISSLKGIGKNGKPGQDVLLITFELDTIKTAMRCLGAATDVRLDEIPEKRNYIERIIAQMKQTYNKRFAIFEWPPDECSVSHVYALLDNLRRTDGFRPDVVILDYMDLMMSRHPALNKDDYTRQKHVANEIRGLAKNENVLVFTATQTNRSGASGEGVADLTKAAESFAKQFSLDYVVSLNQSESQRQATPLPRLSMFIAKNRNGPKHETVNCTINYNNMLVREET